MIGAPSMVVEDRYRSRPAVRMTDVTDWLYKSADLSRNLYHIILFEKVAVIFHRSMNFVHRSPSSIERERRRIPTARM